MTCLLCAYKKNSKSASWAERCVDPACDCAARCAHTERKTLSHSVADRQFPFIPASPSYFFTLVFWQCPNFLCHQSTFWLTCPTPSAAFPDASPAPLISISADAREESIKNSSYLLLKKWCKKSLATPFWWHWARWKSTVTMKGRPRKKL